MSRKEIGRSLKPEGSGKGVEIKPGVIDMSGSREACRSKIEDFERRRRKAYIKHRDAWFD